MIKFYDEHYSSEKMTLVLSKYYWKNFLVGNYDLEILEDWAVKKFTEVPIGLNPNGYQKSKPLAFKPDNIGRFVWYKPVGS